MIEYFILNINKSTNVYNIVDNINLYNKLIDLNILNKKNKSKVKHNKSY